MFTKVLQSTLEKELPAQLQSEEKLREINAELERRVAERTVGLEIANAELRRHVPKREGIEDQLKTSLREVADLKAALEEHAIVATANPQGNHRRMVSSSPKLTHWRSNPTFALIAAISVALLGAAALTGWLLHIESFKCIIPGSAPMKPNMAVGFLLCAAALALLSFREMANPIRVWALSVAVVVIGLTAATLGEQFSGWDFGIDQWWFHNVPGEAGTLHPGRMSLATELCFLLTGSALFTASRSIPMRLRVPLVAGLSAGLLVIGVLPLIGFLLEALFGPQWNYMGMNISGVIGAVGFILLGSGLLALLQSESGLVWSLDALATTGFAIGIILMVVAAAVAFNFTKLMLETTNWVSHRQDVLREIAEATTDMAALTSDQRTYLIVGDEYLLKDRQQTKALLHRSLGAIRRLTADNPNQQRRLDQLEPLIAQRTEWEEQLIAAYRQQGFSAAQQMIASGHGLRLSGEIVRFLKETQGEEYGLLAKDRQQAEMASIAAFSLLPLGVFLSLAILTVGVFFLNARVSEQTQADKAMRQSEAQLHTIVENLDEGVVVSDLDGRLLHWNRAALKLHGYSDSDQDRRRFTELIDTFELSTKDGALVSVEEWPLARVLRGEKVQDLELRVQRIGCDWQRIFHYGGTLVHDATNQPLMAIVTVGDITERKHAEEEIRQLNAELEQRVGQRTAELEAANKELEAFSYSVSHDLRAPLRHVAGFVELLREDAAPSLSEKSVRYLATISQSAKRMGNLIDDLLAFSRVGRSEMQKNDVNLDELVQQTLSEFQVGTNGREITWDVCPLPTVRADRSMLRQVLVNLISNAVKFTGKRTRAEIEVGCASTETKEIVIFVRDNGVGFDPKYTEKLFGVFQRLHSSDEFEGTGIGLANVQRIIHRHGGRVWAEGAVDKGATFYFSIPKQTEA
jgi:signal transduction histidine kinase